MKKIFFVTTNDHVPWGGSEELWFRTARKFAEHGFDIGIGIKNWDPPPSAFSSIRDFKNVTYIYKDLDLGFMKRLYNRISPAAFRIDIKEKYKDAILQWRPSLAVISQGGNNDGTDFMEYFKTHGVTYVTISQALNETRWPTAETAETMSRGFSGAAGNYFVSHSNRGTTELQIGKRLENAKVISNPYNVSYNANPPFPEVNGFYKLACVARFDFSAKGQDVLLEVLHQDKWKTRNLQVNFYGHGEQRQSMEKLIRLFDLRNVYIRGFQQTEDIWKENHGLILPSRYEGLPLALIEAMLCGRMAIVTNVSGNTEVLTDGVSGFIAEAPRFEYIDRAMENAWTRREEWKQLGERARTQIRSLVPADPALEFYNELSALL